MRMPHAAGSPGRSFYLRRTPINGKLRLAVKNDKHLFALIMEVMANTALRLDDPAVQEEQIRIEVVIIEQRHIIQLAGSFMNRFGWLVLRRIGVDDALGQRRARTERKNQNNREQKLLHRQIL